MTPTLVWILMVPLLMLQVMVLLLLSVAASAAAALLVVLLLWMVPGNQGRVPSPVAPGRRRHGGGPLLRGRSSAHETDSIVMWLLLQLRHLLRLELLLTQPVLLLTLVFVRTWQSVAYRGENGHLLVDGFH